MLCFLDIFLRPWVLKTLHPVGKTVVCFAPHLQSAYRYFQQVKTACQGITIAYFMDTSATILIQEAMMDHAADLLCLDRLT